MIKFILGFVLILMPLLVLGDHLPGHIGYTDHQIRDLIDSRITDHSTTTLTIVSFFISGLGGSLVWLFFMIQGNRRAILELDESRHSNHNMIMGKIEESYMHVDEKLNKHVLHVANNYTRDDKIERMMERTVKPMQNQLTALQHSLNDHFNQRSRVSDNTE